MRNSWKMRRGVGHDVLLVLVGAEDAHPAIEKLDNLNARFHLAAQVKDNDIGDPPHEVVPDSGLAEHEALGVGIVAGGTALNHVAGKGEGGAGEPDEGGSVTELLTEQLDGFKNVGGGANLGLDVEGDAHTLKGQHYVSEHDSGIDAKFIHRQQGHLGSQLRRPRYGQYLVLLPQVAVLGKDAASLTHKPDGGGVDGLAFAGCQHALGAGEGECGH